MIVPENALPFDRTPFLFGARGIRLSAHSPNRIILVNKDLPNLIWAIWLKTNQYCNAVMKLKAYCERAGFT